MKSAILPLFFLFLLLNASPGGAALDTNGQGVYQDGQRIEAFAGAWTPNEVRRVTEGEKTRLGAGSVGQGGQAATGVRKSTPHSDFTKAIHALGESLRQPADGPVPVAKVAAVPSSLSRYRTAIEAADRAVTAEFLMVEQKCRDSGVPDEILARQRATVENHRKHTDQLLAELTELEQAEASGDAGHSAASAQRIREFLAEKLVVPDPPFLQSGLPHDVSRLEAPTIPLEQRPLSIISSNSLTQKKPAPTASRSITTVSPLTIGVLAAATDPPLPAHLTATIDVQFTPDISALAMKLGKSPLELYRYVKNTIDFEAYLGSRKGSQETLAQKSGNDYDQASLLLALLRSSGIPARYVRGSVELPVETAKSWLGVDDGATAGSILTTEGMEGVNVINGSGQVTSVRFRHVWVEAYIPYANYRGTATDQTGMMWVPLDPSVKGYALHTGVDILTPMGFNAQNFVGDYITTYHPASPVELAVQQIKDYLAANQPGMTYEDIARTRSIAPDPLGLLPGSTPFTIRSIDSRFAEISDDKRYKIGFQISDSNHAPLIDYTARLPEIAGKQVTISYKAATPADQAVIDSYGDLYATPPYLVRLLPVLKIGGIDVAVGSNSVGMGVTHYSNMTFIQPPGAQNKVPTVSNTIIAGTYQAIGICTNRVPASVYDPQVTSGAATIDDWTGGKLWRTAMTYLDRVRWGEQESAKFLRLIVTNDVSEAIVENAIKVSLSWKGVPSTFEWTGLTVDADRDIVGPFAVNGTHATELAFMHLSGADGSISENRVFEDTYSEEAISTIKILELAADMGISACRITSSIDADCPGFSQSGSVRTAVTTALSKGHVVTIPRAAITYRQWSGTGYIDMNPSTGAAGYIISGGNAGGATVDLWQSQWVPFFTTLAPLCSANPITAVITYPTAGDFFPALDWVSFVTSNKLHFDVDYTICYKKVGSITVTETYVPHMPYGPGDLTFYAGWGTGATRNFTVFGAEIETPAGNYACVGPDATTLKAKMTPRAPPGATYNWSKGTCLLGCGDGTFTPANAVSTGFNGTTAGKIAAKVEVSNPNGTTKAEQDLAAIEIVFSKAPTEDAAGNKFGFDDFDTTTDLYVDHVSVKKNDNTYVNVKVNGAAGDVSKTLFFSSSNTVVADVGALPAPAPATGFLLQIKGANTDKAETTIKAHAGSSSGPVCNSISVNTYKEKVISELKIYRVTDSTSAGTSPLSALDAAALKTFDNAVTKKGVMRFVAVTVEDKDIPYDLNKNGGLDYYWDDSTDEPELKVLEDLHLAGNPKVAHVKVVNFAWRLSAAAAADQNKLEMRGVSYIDDWKGTNFTLGSGATQETVTVDMVNGNELTLLDNLAYDHSAGETLYQPGGGVSSDPAICYDDSAVNDACFLHETLHRPNVGKLLDVNNTKNIMHWQLGTGHTELRYKEQLKNYNNGGDPYENQWETIPR
jgi:transglutaminase-like putative cysteine protease